MKEKPLSRIYYILLGTSIVAGTGFVVWILSILSGNIPEEVQGLDNQLGAMAWVMILFFLVFLVLQNIIYFKEHSNGLPYLFSALVFTTFTGLNYLWLGPKQWQALADLELWQGGFEIRPFWGVVLFGLGIGITLVNFLIARGVRKAQPTQS